MIEPGPSGIRVTMRHVRASGLCASGTPLVGLRAWFSRFDPEVFVQFRREGLPIEWVESLNDAFANRIAEAARKEAENVNG